MSNEITYSQDLYDVARRCVWFQSPDETLADPTFFIAHVLTYGVHSDVTTLLRSFSKDALADALINAPPGIIDPRSWAYWNLILRDLSPPPPMPTRTFDETKASNL
jgi:hypothetical protein